MAEKVPEWMKSNRAKAILSMVATAESPTSSAVLNTNGDKNEVDPMQDTIDKLYARPYSMTSSVFENFCETQNTITSYHFNDMKNNLNKLKDSVLKNKVNITGDIKASSSKAQPTPIIPTPVAYEPLNLTCHETMPILSPNYIPEDHQPEINNSLLDPDFDSDDSVRDKDYVPSDLSKDSDDDEQDASNKKTSYTVKCLPTISTDPDPSLLSKPPRINEQIVPQEVNEENGNEHILPKKRRYETSLAQRTQEKKDKKRMEYAVKPGCKEKCLKKCSAKFCEQDRQNINREYWNLAWEQRRLYVQSRMATAIPKRKYTCEPKRKPKRSFRLHARDGSSVDVCKMFFLTTLGFKENNDKILRINDKTEHITDKRGKHTKTPLYDRQIITDHIESFQPTEPHYRREHAPLRRYLPSDINITHMHNDFCHKYPNNKVSYELYRKHIKGMNISFTQLGHEECEDCEKNKLHKKETSHDETTQLVSECNDCVAFAKHHERYVKARELYAFHKTFDYDEKKIFFTADLEKVIMLPRMETFKSVIFAQRLVAFNMTFARVGKITNLTKPLTVIWHDGIAGRKQEDLMSAFYEFIIRNRDVCDINIWLDNCSAQNKNWLLFSLLVHLVNSDLISTTKITLYFFEPGHTFMSADQVHHQVELAMKKMGKLYDFTDFKEAVASINNGKVSVASQEIQNFLNFPNYISNRRIQKSNPRAYLNNMVQVCFRRNDFGLLYKNDFDDEFTALQFMTDNYLKNRNALDITFRTSPKGLDPQRKAGILDKLKTIIPPHKLQFWKNLPTSESCDRQSI